jgi:hypothetical protein
MHLFATYSATILVYLSQASCMTLKWQISYLSLGDEVICHGCINNGSADMKHAPAGSFKGGHVDMRFPASFGPCNEKAWLDSYDSVWWSMYWLAF